MPSTPAKAISAKTYEALGRSLFTSPGTLLAGAAIAASGTAMAASRSDSHALAWLSAVVAGLGGLRIALHVAYARSRTLPSTAGFGMRPWRRAFAALGLLFSAAFGIAAMTSISCFRDPVSHMVLLTCAVAYAGAVAGRNAGCPEVSVSQLWAVCLPVVFGLLANGGGVYMVMALFVTSYALGMGKISHDLNRALLDAHAAAEERSEMGSKFDLALSTMKHGLVVFDASARVAFCSQSLSNVLGIPKPSRGTGVGAMADACFPRGSGLATHLSDMVVAKTHVTREFPLVDGRTVSVTASPKAGGGCVMVVDDVSARVLANDELGRAARLDALTGLMNRQAFDDALARMIEAGTPVAVLAIDLDRFKAVNDTYGHASGDGLLRSVADSIGSVLPGGALAARFGGDEFMILSDDPASVPVLARAILEAVDKPVTVAGREISVSASIGSAVTTGGDADPAALKRNADTALYRVKDAGRCGWRPYDEAMDAEHQARKSLEADLRVAIAEDRFQVVYQPQLHLATGTVPTCEALVRWNHPVRGPIPPDAFIPLAEETGLIHRIGLVVLERACEEAMRWPSDVRVAVNLSPVQFRRDIATAVQGVLERTGLPGRRLELEVTESVLMDDRDAVKATFLRLAAMGVSIALDDFGTGYSSLSYLRSFPFRTVKLDRSFVKGLSDGPGSLAIIRAMTSLGQDLGMDVVVEGVETHADLLSVRTTACTTIQGYHFSRPLPPAELVAFLGTRGALVAAA